MSAADPEEFAETEITMESLFNLGVDEEAEKKLDDALLLERGKYLTQGHPLIPKIERPDRGNHKGRLMVRFFGPIESLSTGVKGGIGYRMSPELRQKDDGKPDLASKLWAQARNLAKRAGAFDSTVGSVVDFLATTPVSLFLIKMDAVERDGDSFDASNLVVGINKA